MSAEPAVNTVVEVFMDRRSEYLPRLARIAEIMADCARTSVSDATSQALTVVCDSLDSASSKVSVRFSLHNSELDAEVSCLSPAA
jgi:hypothetical protein